MSDDDELTEIAAMLGIGDADEIVDVPDDVLVSVGELDDAPDPDENEAV